MSGAQRPLRLDQRLVAEGLAPSRAKAEQLILSGAVQIAGRTITKPAHRASGEIELGSDPNPWVSRAGLKLEHALDTFSLEPMGTALDLGASTGGFTEVLLARGADHVFAVDVGHGQLHPRLSSDPRVTNIERRNARHLQPGDVPQVDWITADLSFVSLSKVLPHAFMFAKPGCQMVALVKPQFEAGRERVGKNGIVRDPAVHAEILASITSLVEELGWAVVGSIESPILGGDGNKEFLLAARRET